MRIDSSHESRTRPASARLADQHCVGVVAFGLIPDQGDSLCAQLDRICPKYLDSGSMAQVGDSTANGLY